MDRRRAAIVARDVVREMRAHNITFMAGSIAHAAFLSLLPLLLLLLIVASAVGNELLTERIISLSRTYLSPAGEGLVFEALTSASERAGASVLGVVTLVWGMLRIFRGVNTAFDELYGGGEEGIVEQALEIVIVLVVVVLATVGVGVAAVTVGRRGYPFAGVVDALLLVVTLALAFLPMYYVFPEPDVTVREVLPGAAFAAAGWAAMEFVFGLYTAATDTVAFYGAFGAAILLLIWLYGGAFALLAGATLNVVLAGRHRERDGEEPAETPRVRV